MFKLIVRSGSQNSVEVALDGSRLFSLGRHKTCSLQLLDRRVSRRHATLILSGGFHILKDDQSNNGTFVNGVRIQRTKLSPDDRIQIGETVLDYCRELPTAAPVPAARTHENPRKTNFHPRRVPFVPRRDLLANASCLILAVLVGWLLLESAPYRGTGSPDPGQSASVPEKPEPIHSELPPIPDPAISDKVHDRHNPSAPELRDLAKAENLVEKADKLRSCWRSQPPGSGWSSRALDYLYEAENILEAMKISDHNGDNQDAIERSRTVRQKIRDLRVFIIKTSGY